MAIKGEKRIFGFGGERKAARYLKKQGYKILKRNYKCPFGEVDIIACKEEVVAFIEVKTRSYDDFGMPSQAVTREKQQRYLRCARFYYAGKQINDIVRFDIIEVLDGKINHIENAYSA